MSKPRAKAKKRKKVRPPVRPKGAALITIEEKRRRQLQESLQQLEAILHSRGSTQTIVRTVVNKDHSIDGELRIGDTRGIPPERVLGAFNSWQNPGGYWMSIGALYENLPENRDPSRYRKYRGSPSIFAHPQRSKDKAHVVVYLREILKKVALKKFRKPYEMVVRLRWTHDNERMPYVGTKDE